MLAGAGGGGGGGAQPGACQIPGALSGAHAVLAAGGTFAGTGGGDATFVSAGFAPAAVAADKAGSGGGDDDDDDARAAAAAAAAAADEGGEGGEVVEQKAPCPSRFSGAALAPAPAHAVARTPLSSCLFVPEGRRPLVDQTATTPCVSPRPCKNWATRAPSEQLPSSVLRSAAARASRPRETENYM